MSTFVTMLQKETYQLLRLRQIGAVFLCLFLFISSQFRFQFQHYLAHSTAHEILHDQETEADACHQAIFHQGSTTACDHPTHLSSSTIECELCDCVLELTEFSLLAIELATPLLVSKAIFDYTPSIDHSPLSSATARGPPFVISNIYC